MLASTVMIQKVVKTLCAAHGKAPSAETFDAYRIALDPYGDGEVESGLVTALREQREFMPPPGIVAGFAKEVRNARLRAANVPDDRRLVCLTCQDRGSVIILNRQWLFEHRDEFCEDWFVEGWMRQAAAWCRNHCQGVDGSNGRKALFWMAVCCCECRNATVFRNQAKRYAEERKCGTLDEKKTPRPAFGFQFDESRDCLTGSTGREEVEASLLRWRESDSKGRTWSGNWQP